MKTNVRNIGGLPVEEPSLSGEGQERQHELSDLVLQAYAQTGELSGNKVRETVAEYEADIGEHVEK